MESEELSKLTYEVVVQGRDIDAAVSDWLAANGKVVDGWLGLN